MRRWPQDIAVTVMLAVVVATAAAAMVVCAAVLSVDMAQAAEERRLLRAHLDEVGLCADVRRLQREGYAVTSGGVHLLLHRSRNVNDDLWIEVRTGYTARPKPQGDTPTNGATPGDVAG